MANETDGFLRPKPSAKVVQPAGCCHSKHTWNCCVATAVIGAVVIVLGIVAIAAGKGMLEASIIKSMALTPGSDRLHSWLKPPVQPHLTAYAFHITNPNAVLQGKKPIMEEVGPFVYKATTVKDSSDNMIWNHEEGKLTYRPRKVYNFVPELSVGNPDNTYITVPNIPLWTGLNGIRDSTGTRRSIGLDIVLSAGAKTPFVNVTLSGLLWGYKEELPCLKLDLPSECGGFGDFGGFGDEDGGDDDEWDFKRRKRSVGSVHQRSKRSVYEEPQGGWDSLVKPKAEFVDCECEWGLFRDRNITLRKPVEFLSGELDVMKKGIVTKYDGSDVLNWWKSGSVCDQVKGFDGATFPPNLGKENPIEVYIALMCRSINLEFEKETEHAGIRSYRFIPPVNALGSHDDPDPAKRNPDNECYCLKDEGYKCFKTGVYNMEPCKRDTKAPLALSMPHFYQADQSFHDAVGGMKPEKEKHQFYVDIVPEFGFPLAIRPRFQLNLIIGRFEDWDVSENMKDEIVMPFLWAQDGFSEPSEEMADAIKFGLAAPEKLPLFGAVILFVIGGVMVLTSLSYFLWQRRVRSKNSDNVVPT